MTVCFIKICADKQYRGKRIAMIIPKLLVFCVIVSLCNSAMDAFIEGGEYAKIEHFPHSVFLYLECKDPESCGGSILTQRIVLTAAHCFDSCLKKMDIIAYVGSDDTDAMTVSDKIINFYLHHNYEAVGLTNDIALGLVKTELPLGDTIKRVIIDRNFPGVLMAKTAGWGVVNDDTLEDTERLKMVIQIVQPRDACSEVTPLKEGMMCAKNNARNHPAQGDSGSALVSKKGQEIGLVSWRVPNRKDVIIYTNVSYYYDWILKYSKRLYCSKFEKEMTLGLKRTNIF